MANVTPEQTKEALDKVSCSYCVAKWLQVTIHLDNGTTHSCHHPQAHKIPLDEIAADPSALHNTKYKKEQRKLMLEGKRPKECDYCWNIEDSGNLSDRTYKSHDPWARPYIDSISHLPWDTNVSPTYVEVAFSNVCNFKCSYCGPLYSSKWMEEIKQHGPYPTTDQFNSIANFAAAGIMPIPEREDNPYVEAFWKWWPDLYKTMRVFRITGGEPLLSKHTFRVLEYIRQHPNPTLQIAVNSNLGVPDELLDKFIEMAAPLTAEKCVLSFKVFTSVDAQGKRAEYIRHGLQYEKFMENCRKVMKGIPRCGMTFMSTYNALSVTSYKEFLDDVVEMKREFPGVNKNGVLLDIPYLRFPAHQSVKILTPDYLDEVARTIEYMAIKHGDDFFASERDKLKRIYDWMKAPGDERKTDLLRSDFFNFVNEHDRRRGTNFLDTFPEMEEFYKVCRVAAELKAMRS